ncbi:MAG: heparinase II/III family protein, partial [Oscillospiraceae bacterium]|nr:heparinase II/III family protein [Oscillospiraceae bacterium]
APSQGYTYDPENGVYPAFLALEIVIDEPGAYTPSLAWQAQDNSPYVDIYLIKAPTDKEEAAAWKTTVSKQQTVELKELCYEALIGVDPLGTVKMVTDGDTSPKALSPIKIAEKGSYYLVFVPNGADGEVVERYAAHSSATPQWVWIQPKSFSLTKIEDDSDIPEMPEKFEISFSNEGTSFDFTVPETGAYDLFFKFAKNASGGTGYAYIDGKYVGEADFYSSTAKNTNSVEFRSVSLEAGMTHTLTLVAAENGAGGSAGMYPKGMVLRAAETLAQPTKLLLSFPNTDLILGDTVWADVKYEFDNGSVIPAHEKSLETIDTSSAYTLEVDGTAVTVGAGGLLSSAEPGTAKVRAVTGELTSEWVSVTVIKKQIGSAEITTPKEWILLSNSEGMKMNVTAKYNTGDDVDVANDASIAYRSSDETIATVTQNGIILPVGAGEATVYADVTVEDAMVTAEKKILISKNPIYPDVFVNFNYDGVVNDAAVTATLEVQGWGINKEKTDAALLADGIIKHKTNYGLQVQGSTAESNNTLAIDFVVPETCAYDLVMKHCIVGNGGTAYIYIDGIYAGEVNFHNKTQVNDSFTPLRSFYLEEGKTHTLTLVSMKNGGNGNARMYPGGLKLTGNGELAGISAVTFKTERSSIAAGETELYEVYARQENGVEFFPRASLDGVTETGLTVESSDTDVAVLENGYIKGISPGKADIRISGRLNGTDVDKAFEFTVNENTYKEAKIDVAIDKFFIGGKTELSVSAYLSDGSRINDRDISVSFASDKTDVAEVSGKTLSMVAEGEAKIIAQITFNGQTYTEEKKIKVVPISIERIEASIKETIISSFSDAGAKISVKAFNNDGTDASLEGAVYSYESMTPDIVSVTEDGYVCYVSAGKGIVKVTASLGGVDLTYDLEVVSSSGKTEPTVFTYEMRENARDNISKYSWAKSKQKTAVANAERDIANLDAIYDLIMYEGIPRSFTPALLNDPKAYSCVYCGIDIRKKYSQYGWVMDPLTRPWQIQCPDCKRLFPSNDFESFYELGLDQKGQFDRTRALEAHRELFVDKENSPASPGTKEWSADWCAYYGYGKGYLKNELYKEVGETLGVATDKVATWAVDDGYGWETGTTNDNGYPIKKAFVAVYNHFLYSNMNSSNVIIQALDNLREAYVYTGDIKYGRAGAILIDRLADVYPSYNLAPYAMYQNSHGGGNAGKILGNIWENSLAKALINAYDAFWPAMEDPQVIDYLSEKAVQFGLENPKTSADMIRENCETGILREVFKGVKAAQMKGNFGMAQETAALAGIALDTYPESAEIFEWIESEQKFTTTKGCPVVGYPDRTATVYTASSGGDIFNTIINRTDRDGFGDEGSAQYNLLWVTRTLNMAEAFHRYGKYDGLNLYENVKYKKMLTSILNMTVGSGYTLQIGDDNRTGSLENETSATAVLRGFERIGDPAFAQVVYLLKDGDLEGTYIDIYEKNAEDIQDRIKAAVEAHGELSFGSRNLTGYGLAVLAGGKAVASSNTQENSNFSRDTWLWYGDTSGGHGHYDKLQMGINAYGFNFTPDLGYPAATGTDANRLQWVATTLSHNTVTVNEEAQLGSYMADALHYDADGIVKVVDAEDSSVYTATDIYRRTLV